MKFRRFLAMILALAMMLSCVPIVSAQDTTGIIDLIPDEANLSTPNYVCTWSNQDWTALSSDAAKAHASSVPRDMLNHEQLFDPETGWCYTAYQDSKQDLIFLLDDGWDLPYSSQSNYMSFFASLLVNEEKFPGYGDTPQERLKTLVDNIEAAGWKGAGVWICANTNTEDYWRERLEWSAYAGVDYWKIDWGSGSGNTSWRQMISNLADEIAPDLVIEHIVGYSTLNTSADGGTRMSDSVAQASADRGSFADVYRSYDVNGNLSIATTFERLGKHLQYAYTDGRQLGLLNGEDEVYMCSALGLSFGVMRYDIGDASSGSLPNIFFGGAEDFTESRPIRKMLDEVKRATMWQRIAPAYRVDAYKTVISDETLADSWIYSSEDTWDTGTTSAGSGNAKTQKAPAIIARGIDMPVVNADANGVKPFVAVSRNPNGAISIGTYGRTTPAEGYQAVYSDITLNAGDLTGKIGVFGYYDSLTLTFNQDLTGKTIYAQDMMDTVAGEDITDLVTISADGNSVTFDGELLSRIGLSGATESYSEPGLVIQIGGEADFEEAPDTIASSLIPNGSFEYTVTGESADKPDPRNWTETGTSANSFVEVGQARNGSSYAVLQQSAGISASASVPDGIYNISAWVRSDSLTGSASMTVSGHGGEDVAAAITPAAEWTQITLENVSVTSGSVNVAFAIDGGAGDYIHVDMADLSLSEDVSLIAGMIRQALAGENGSNDMTADDIQALVDASLWAYTGTGITAEVSDFVLLPSSDSDNGRITANVTVSNGTDSETVAVSLVIPKAQVVCNPSFEIGSTVNGDPPQGWDIWAAEGYDVNSFCYVESKSDWLGGAHTGSWYGSTWGYEFECSTSQTVSVPNGKYTVSVWVQNTAFTGTDYTDTGCAGYFGVSGYGGKTKFVALDEEHLEWTKLTIEDVVVTTGQMEIGIYLNNDTGTEHWVKFDDFSIEPVANAITLGEMKNGTLELSRTEAIPGASVTVTALPADQYRMIEGTLKVYKTNDPYVTVPVTEGVFTMPGYGVTVEAKFERATPQTYQYLPVDQLTGYAESWASDTTAASAALDGNTAKGSNWHSNHPTSGTAETDDNHCIVNEDSSVFGGANNPMAKYNNYYIVLDEAMSVDKISVASLWDNNSVTNGTIRIANVYVSAEDYGESKEIEWGQIVGSTPEGGWTFSGAGDAVKEIAFTEAQSNVKTIRIEVKETWANGGNINSADRNKWIRVMEFGVSAKEMEEVIETGPEAIDKSRLTGYAESWQSGAGAENALDGDTWSNWHSMYSGTETDDNHITEDADGNETTSAGGAPMAKYNNYYIVIDEPATVENISIHGKYDGGITNGTVKKCNIYVSSEDYSQNQDIDWGQAVGSSPEGGFTYAGADDMNKLVEFAAAQENVKSIRIEVTESYSGYGHAESKWIRVTEFDLNVTVPDLPEIPALPDEDPIYTIAAVADYHTDYGIELYDNPIRESVTITMERIREEEAANVIVALGDLFSANVTKYWFSGSDADREAVYNNVLDAMYTTTESGMEDPRVMYIAGNHEVEVGLKAFNSHSFVEDGTERTMGEMVAAESVTDVEANAYFQSDLTGKLTNAEGKRNVLAYHYNVDGLDFIALNPPYTGVKNSGTFEYDRGALEWVRNKMASIGSDKTVVMIGHYPVGLDFRNQNGASLTSESDQLLRAILKEHPNTIYLYGHVHDDYIVSDTYQTIVAYEEDANTVYTDRYSAPSGVITAFAGSMGYYGNSAGLVPQGGLTAQTPNYIQALMIYIYSDRIVFQMKNYGEAGGELEPYTVMRQVEIDYTVDKTGLAQAVAEAEALVKEDYDQELWAELTEKLTAAKAVLEDENATRKQVENAESELRYVLELMSDNFGFAGKTISILGDSISTFEDISEGAGAETSNTTIAGNDLYYRKGTFGVYQADTWWQQTADRLGMRILVNNAWSASTVFSDRTWPDPVSKGYLERTQNLHDNTGDNAGEEPDIIAVFMGTNDFSDNPTLGQAVTDHTTLITENEDGTYTYKTPTTLAEAYSIMLYRITRRYPDAEVYCLSLLARENETEGDTQRIREYSEVFKATAEYYGAVFVDQYHDTGITSDSENAAWYMGNTLHPNPAGMDAITNTFISALLKYSDYSNVKDSLADVSYELEGTIVKEGTVRTAILGRGFSVSFVENDKPMHVTVTMNGEDVTDLVCADGTVSIGEVTGDIQIKAWLEADKTALEQAIDNAKLLKEDDYISESWNGFAEALVQAEAVLDNEKATQKEVDAAAEALAQALESLVEKTAQEKYEEIMAIVEAAQKDAEESQALAEAAKQAAEEAEAAAKQAQKAAEEILDTSDENTEAAIAAAAAAEAAQKKAEEAAARAEAAETAAGLAADAADAAAEAAGEANLDAAKQAAQAAADALSAAESEAAAAASAQQAAENAAAAAAAQKAAAEAQAKAEAAQAAAEAAQAKAEAAQADAEAAAESTAQDRAAVEAAAEAAENAKQAAQNAAAEAETAQSAAEAAAKAANDAMDKAEDSSNEAMQEALEAARDAAQAAEQAEAAAQNAAVVAGYAADAARAQRAAQEAQARAEQAKKDAEEAAQKAEQERLEAEAAQAAAEAEAEAAKKAAELETAKQAALVRIMLYTDAVDTASMDEETMAQYTDAVYAAMDAVDAAASAEEANAAVDTMIGIIEALTAVHECFDDVAGDAWYHEAVDYVFENGHMIGVSDELFDPEGKLTRAQFATILYRLEGAPETAFDDRFTDVAEGEWYTAPILWASDSAIVLGYNDGSFGVDDDITREQMVVMLYRYVTGYMGEDAATDGDLTGFADGEAVSEWACEAVSWAVSVGLIRGSEDPDGLNLDPQGSTTRAECAAIIQRFLENGVQ